MTDDFDDSGCTRCSYFSITRDVDGCFTDKFSTSDWMVNPNSYTFDKVNFVEYSDGTKKKLST